MGIGHEKLLHDVHNGEDGGHLVSEALCGGFRNCLCVCSLVRAARQTGIETRGARLRRQRNHGQDGPKELWEMAEEAPGPVGVAKQGTRGQHGVGKHSCMGLKKIQIV